MESGCCGCRGTETEHAECLTASLVVAGFSPRYPLTVLVATRLAPVPGRLWLRRSPSQLPWSTKLYASVYADAEHVPVPVSPPHLCTRVACPQQAHATEINAIRFLGGGVITVRFVAVAVCVCVAMCGYVCVSVWLCAAMCVCVCVAMCVCVCG